MLTPTHRITAARLEIEMGLADLRADVERQRAAVARDTATLVDTEEYLNGLRLRARRARGHRHLLPPETEGPRRPAGDLRAADYPRAAPDPVSRPAPSTPRVSVRPVTLDDTLDGLSVDEVFNPESTLPSVPDPTPHQDRKVHVGEVLVGSFNPRGAVVAESPVDESTRRSLIRMGLARDPDAPKGSPQGVENWLARARRALNDR